MLSCLVCFTMFVQAWSIFNEAFASLPNRARAHLYGIMFCFYSGWTAFGLLFTLGPEGWGTATGIQVEIVAIGHILADFIAKLVYGFLGWHLRWRVLRGMDGKRLKEEEASKYVVNWGARATSSGARQVLMCCAHNDYTSVVLKTKINAYSLQVHTVHTVDQLAAVLDSEPHLWAFVVISLPYLRQCNGDIANHPRLYARSPLKMLPLITYTNQIGEEDFMFIRGLEVDDFIDAPFFDEDVGESVQNALSYARQLRAIADSDTAKGGQAPFFSDKDSAGYPASNMGDVRLSIDH